MVFYTEEDNCGGTMLCATIADLTAQLRQTLWRQERPVVLTSATLAVGEDFRRFKEETGLLTDSRVTESVAPSPFDYQQNCLLYLPQIPPRQKAAAYYDELAKEIAALLNAAQGHALALFTSYAAMSAVKERLPGHGLRYPLFTMGRSAIHTTEQFKASPGSVLLAAGAAWEGFDFPGDCVSLLIIPRLPFAVPDALKEKERENHPTLRLFIRAVVVPERHNSYAAALLKALFHLPLTLPRLGGPVAGQLLLGPLFPGVNAGRRRSGRVHHHPLQPRQAGIAHEISCHILLSSCFGISNP